MAASMAWVSNGFRFFSPERSRRPVDGLMRFSTAASGTSLTRTQIFTGSWPPVTERAFASYCESSPIDLSVNHTAARAGAPGLWRDRALDVVDDGLGRRTGREDLGDPELLELGDVLGRDGAPDGDDDVARVLLAQQLDDLGDQRHVGAREDREADGVGVLLEDGLDDLLRRLVQARVDDLHAGVAQRAGDDLRAAVMAVEARLGHDDADLPVAGRGHRGASLLDDESHLLVAGAVDLAVDRVRAAAPELVAVGAGSPDARGELLRAALDGHRVRVAAAEVPGHDGALGDRDRRDAAGAHVVVVADLDRLRGRQGGRREHREGGSGDDEGDQLAHGLSRLEDGGLGVGAEDRLQAGDDLALGRMYARAGQKVRHEVALARGRLA